LHAQIEILASLQTVDREIKEQTGLKQGLLSELRAKELDIQAKQKEVDALVAAAAEKEKLRAEKDRVFQEEGRKAVDKRMRVNRVKNSKEFQALQREIDLMRLSNGELEEELIKIMQEIDTIMASKTAKEAEMAALQEAWQKQQQELGRQIGGIDQAVTEALSRRQSIAANLARDLISRYELIFSRRGGTAVVEIAGGICQGCFMNIPAQMGNEIVSSTKIHLCPSCQRIVYIRSVELEEAKSA
jgi:predicted  nucleic acid-binding Zn-ribbon protein